jgi:hypothetical protein
MAMVPSNYIDCIPEIINLGLLVLNTDGEIIYANPWISERLGRSTGSCPGEFLTAALPEVIELGKAALERNDACGTVGRRFLCCRRRAKPGAWSAASHRSL